MGNEEQIMRIAKAFGNGAHIFVPKEWAGEQIVLIKPQRKSVRERIISVIDPYLDSVVGVYLYGSYARGEQIYDSDIDLFIIAERKIKINIEGMHIICLEQKELEKAIKLEPLLMYSVLSEAKPIINSKLIEDLKKNYKPKIEDFEEFLKDCRRIIKINEEFLEAEKDLYLKGEAVIYSIVLRLRGVFILKSLLKGEKYTHKSLKSWIKGNVPEIDFKSIYEAYRDSKSDKKLKQKIKVNDIKSLLKFLEKEVGKL